jgi:hypothetical protein
MDLATFGAIAEIVGTAAIIVSLFYLAAQIRQNTRSARSATYQSIVSHIAEAARVFVEDPELAQLLMPGGRDLNELSPEERARFDLAVSSAFRHYDGIYYHYTSGALESDQWEGFHHKLTQLLAAPAVATWWREQSAGFSGRFVSYVNQELMPAVGKDDAA